MGRDLLALAHSHPARLTPPQRVVLERMALTALDRGSATRPSSLYFGGYGPLAIALGREWPADDDGSSSAQLARDAAAQAVRRALRGLRALGLIEFNNVARHGVRQEYRLLLEDLAPRPSRTDAVAVSEASSPRAPPSLRGVSDRPSSPTP